MPTLMKKKSTSKANPPRQAEITAPAAAATTGANVNVGDVFRTTTNEARDDDSVNGNDEGGAENLNPGTLISLKYYVVPSLGHLSFAMNLSCQKMSRNTNLIVLHLHSLFTLTFPRQ